MSWLTIIGISVGMAMDAFAVAVVTGMASSKVCLRRVFRLAFHFGLFQFLMPILGWLSGRTVATHIESYDHWIAFGLLSFVGGKMLWEAFHDDEDEREGDPTRGWMLVTLSVATSIDALAVGLSLAFLSVSIWVPSVSIGIITFFLTGLGMWLGRRFGDRIGKWAEIVGGIVLLIIGLRILFSHLFLQ